MKQLKTQLSAAASSFNGKFRAACIGAVGLLAANSATASLLDEGVTEALGQAQTDGEAMGKIILVAVSVIACLGILVALLRKA